MKKFTYLLILPVILFFGCNKALDVSTAPNVLYPAVVFSDSANVKSAVLGLYAGMQSTNTYNVFQTIFPALYADDVNSLNYSTVSTNTLTPADGNVGNIWFDNYSLIYRANALIAGIQTSGALSATTKNQYIGEALFFRAYCHFNLINIFGSIPLITSSDALFNASLPQTANAAVYQQMIQDLQQAVADLPANYSVSSNERTRVNKFAAIAMLAKVYLYNQDWANAEAQANLVISNPLFSMPALSSVFLNTSTEAIFQLDNKPSGTAAIAGSFIPARGAVPAYQLTPSLLASFETGDTRRTAWVGASAGYSYPAKYKIITTGGNEYLTILRLAEMYLIRAEARAHQSNVSGAQSDLNTVRRRAGLGNTLAADQPSLLLAIEQERRVELFCEWGNRFYDLKRTGRADVVLGAAKPTWNSTDVNFPIPLVEMTKNSNLKQNPGYN